MAGACAARAALAAGLCACLVLAVGCAVHPPELLRLDHRLVLHQDEAGGRQERLLVFVAAQDRDGREDLAAIYVVHDGSELYWQLGPESWQQYEQGGSLWLGSPGLTGTAASLPRGEYRVILVDQAGLRDETSLRLQLPETSSLSFPSLRLHGESVLVSSPYAQNSLFFLDAGGNVVRTATVDSGATALTSAWGDDGWRQQARYIALYSLDLKAETGLLTWRLPLP